MKLVQLRVRGFRRLKDLDLDLDHDRVLVVGPNEAGKSTLMEALLAGLYGLAPAKRGSGHAGALRSIQPWSGDRASIALQFRLDGGRMFEADWDFSGEQTRVIDLERGEDVTVDFTPGTHGWLDLGERLLGLPGGVFKQVTSVGEGQLASLSDEGDIRQAVLQLTDAGVDVNVEHAMSRLDEAARQATVPRSNSATRRNELGKELTLVEAQLQAARSGREELEKEVGAIKATEAQLTSVRQDLARILATEEEREMERQKLRSQIDRAEGRLAEAELRLAATANHGRDAKPRWIDADLEEARQHLVTPPARTIALQPETLGGGALVLLGVATLVLGGLKGFLPLVGLALGVIGGGVYLLTRGGLAGEPAIRIGPHLFPDRQSLMEAIDEERARRDHAVQHATVHELRAQFGRLSDLSIHSDDEIEVHLRAAEELQSQLALQLERERASYERGSLMVPEVAPLEERVADLHARIARLDEFGAAATRAGAELGAAAEAIRRNYAPKLQEYLSRDLKRMTGGRYTEATVNDRFQVLLRAPETGGLVDMSTLSRGTQQQIYLLLRLGLLELMGAGTERLPLFLDDALALADDRRRTELLRVVEGENRQVVYFTASESMSNLFGKTWTRVGLEPPPVATVKAAPVRAPRKRATPAIARPTSEDSPASDLQYSGSGELPIALVEDPV
ncbi:MAG: ATP-binding protein [Candidatus Dormibacteria bacterium]